jgi:hypothetical protein
LQDWTKKSATAAAVEVFILDTLYPELPRPPFTVEETDEIAARGLRFCTLAEREWKWSIVGVNNVVLDE